jgi:4-alpha-glucanotransferase
LITAALYDVLGVLDQPNMSGTTDQYPNWRMPIATSLEDIEVDPRVRRIAAVLSARKGTTS